MFDPTPPNAPVQPLQTHETRTAPVVPAPSGMVAPEEIHTMPSKFLDARNATPGNRHLVLMLSAAGALVIIAVGGYLLYRNFRATAPIVNANVNANAGTNALNTNATDTVNANVSTSNANAINGNTNATAPTVLKQTLTDPDTDAVVSTATLTLPFGAVPDPDTIVNMISLSATVGAYATSKTSTPIGGVFLLTPAKTKLAKKATIQITYAESSLLALGVAARESSLTIAYWNGTDWTPINSVVDEKANVVTADITEFYNDGLAIVAPKTASTNANTNTALTNTAPGAMPLVPSQDTDADGLTDQEELLYGTVASDPDTDDDTYRDGQEVVARYNPNGKNKLADAGLVKTHQNATYRYSMFYPPSWTVGSLNAEKLVLFTSITGEFVQVSVQSNAGGLSAREWYQSLNPSVSDASLKDVTVGSLLGIIGPDSINVYLADKANVYQITYNVGIKTEANYLSTFTMMYMSFLTNIAVTQPVDITTNTNSGSNANTNGNANTNSSSNTNSANTNAVNANTTNTNRANANTNSF